MAQRLLEADGVEAAEVIRPYIGGGDIVNKNNASRRVIDLNGYEQAELRRRLPAIYSYLLQTVKKQRDETTQEHFSADAKQYAERWWRFAKDRADLRNAVQSIGKYIATVETVKHRLFQFVPANVVPNHMVIAVALDDEFSLGILSSRTHLEWTYANCGLLGVAKFEQGHRYTKSKIFDRFPFPDASADQRTRIGDIAEELDATRKEVLAKHPDLTLTTLYNLREKLVKGEAFSPKEEDQRMRGRVDIVAELHDRLDAAVAEAYGWPADLSDEEIVARLVALNAERAAEERRGIVRWLRPEYQQKKAGIAVMEKKPEAEQIEAVLTEAKAAKPSFPRDAIGQTAAVLADLRSGGMLSAEEIAARYKQGKRLSPRIEATLQALTRLGHLAHDAGRYRMKRAA